MIFTSVQPGAADADGMHRGRNPINRAHVVYIKDVQQASTDTTEKWLENMCKRGMNYLPEDSTLVCDVAPWHVSKEAQAIFNQRELNIVYLPAGTGKWLNPCDQSIHREIRREFDRLMLERPNEKLLNVIDAYYSVRDDVVRNSWRHTGLLEEDYETRLRHAAAEGFRPGAGRDEMYSRASESWDGWKSENLRHDLPVEHGLRADVGHDCALDGRRHTYHGTK